SRRHTPRRCSTRRGWGWSSREKPPPSRPEADCPAPLQGGGGRPEGTHGRGSMVANQRVKHILIIQPHHHSKRRRTHWTNRRSATSSGRSLAPPLPTWPTTPARARCS